jgi:hypothetical protein
MRFIFYFDIASLSQNLQNVAQDVRWNYMILL